MSSMAPEKELAVAHVKARSAKVQTDAPSEFRATSTVLLSSARYSGRGQKGSVPTACNFGSLMIAFLTIELRIEAAHSLKDKRQVTRSLKDRLRSSFNVAVAELDPSLLWNQATIGVVSVSHSRDYLDGLMKNVERQATRIANNAGAEVTDSFVEFL
jgi:uncharacterized protein YlxP (DUF503 family)